MAGVMNKECLLYGPLLTEHLLLGTPLPEELSRHVDGCPECAREVSLTDDVVRTLRRADPLAGRIAARAPAPRARPSEDLVDRIRRDMDAGRDDGDAGRDMHAGRDVYAGRNGYAGRSRRPGRRFALGVAAAFVTAAAVAVPLTLHQDRPAPATSAASVVLHRQGRMVERPWGTEVPVALSGLRPGETYRMMTVNAAGKRVPGGSVRAATGDPVSTRMVTAMRRATITGLIVEDAHGHVVGRVPVVKLPPPSA
ncbi:hypothetical protein G3I19_04210 [Streptomyces sp. SID10853]|uniref:hypothetical protein n=1 Tax=Streptomyces sp. SID10853 TaxID=2706028 RepID=UPI0013BF7CF3|nr:hypothetical protein [Streptomyces sp. SID10853]NDZ77738.1 hypothetical protein [Streptomyces sp. SID10853]